MVQVTVEREITARAVFYPANEDLKNIARDFTKTVSDMDELLTVFRPARGEAVHLLKLILLAGTQKVKLQRVYIRNVFFEGKKSTFRYYHVPESKSLSDLLFLVYNKKLYVAEISNVKRFIAQNEWDASQ